MYFNVIFEGTTKAGGYAGIRTWTSYKDKAEFTQSGHSHNIKAIAEGVTEDEALNLCSLTPEVCYLTVAVQEMCHADGNIDLKLAPYPLANAHFAIAENRKHRLANGLHPSTSFLFVEIGTENSEKNRLYRYIKRTFTNPNGTIGNIELAIALINVKVAEIVLDRLIV